MRNEAIWSRRPWTWPQHPAFTGGCLRLVRAFTPESDQGQGPYQIPSGKAVDTPPQTHGDQKGHPTMTPAQTQTPVYGKPPLCLEVQRGCPGHSTLCSRPRTEPDDTRTHILCAQTHLAGPPAHWPQASHTLWPFGQ